MAGKKQSRARSAARPADTAQAIRDSAQKIWLAGLGAYERARKEGPRMFELLVDQGRRMGARAAGAADQALKGVRESGAVAGSWDKLEQVFEERVSRSLQRLGVLTRNEVEDLARQVQGLNDSLRAFMAGAVAPPARRAASKRSRKASTARRRTKAAKSASRKGKGTRARRSRG
ncbi:MAG TPA: phasin family protein [Usitatibacter sp.]|nr:phasin family protein [Usitatibacter sp.]